MDIEKTKQEMCDIGHRIWLRRYCAGNEGNHSVRIDDDRILCTPSGVSKGFLSPEMICLMDMSGNRLDDNPGYRPTSEINTHIEIYKKRYDVKSVIHSHPTHATAFAITGIPLPEGIHPEAELFLGHVPVAKFAIPSKQELTESIVPLIQKDTRAVIMESHGVICFAETLETTYYKLEILDAYCQILLLTKSIQKPRLFSNQQMKELLKLKQAFGEKDSRLECIEEGCANNPQTPFLQNFEPDRINLSENDLEQLADKIAARLQKQ